jgi:8-oxo-dGTP pyrophosphatase MutT (NUDIX family)
MLKREGPFRKGNPSMAIQPSLIRQAAVIPVRNGQVCLVSSRSGKRWVVPKGCMEPGKTAGEIALQEAWEEAGLVGLLQHEPLGSYVYEKDGFTCHVIVFLLTVTDSVETYPESDLRQRVWLPISQATTRVDESSLRELLRAVAMPRAG